MDCYAKAIRMIGPTGAGQGKWRKWSTRSASPASCRDWPKGCTFANARALIPPSLIESISKGAAQSWQMENRWQTMVNDEFDFGFAVDWMRKDLASRLRRRKRIGATSGGWRNWSTASMPRSRTIGRQSLGHLQSNRAPAVEVSSDSNLLRIPFSQGWSSRPETRDSPGRCRAEQGTLRT